MSNSQKPFLPLLVLVFSLFCCLTAESQELFGVRRLGNTNDDAIIMINPVNGFASDFATVGNLFLFNALASDNLSNLYVVGFSSGQFRLGKIVPFSGEVIVGPPTSFPFANADSAKSLAWHPDFGLYAMGINDELIQVDLMTGEGTLIGSVGSSLGVQGLAFAPDGRLFGWSVSAAGLIEIDPNDATYVNVSGTNDGFGGIQSLEFSDEGTLYGCNDFLYEIDTATGSLSLIGGVGLNDIRGMAFTQPVALSQFPEAFDLIRGEIIAGTDLSLRETDDERLILNPGFVLNSTEAPIWMVVDAALATSDKIRFGVESQAGTPGLTLTVEAWNWNTGTYDVIDSRSESFNSDTFESFVLDYEQHLAFNGQMRSRVGWRKTGFTLNFPWEVRVDWLVWTL